VIYGVVWGVRGNYNPGAIKRHYLYDPMFSRFDTIPECDRETQDDGIYHS